MKEERVVCKLELRDCSIESLAEPKKRIVIPELIIQSMQYFIVDSILSLALLCSFH